MLIPLNYLIEKYVLKINGISHFGAHLGQEISSYLDNGIKNIHLFEPQAEIYKSLVENFKEFNLNFYNFALGPVETTWLSIMNDDSEKDYQNQIKKYLENHLNLKEYKINYKEEGAIPLFYPSNKSESNKINIGTAGGMTRLSTGYTFLNIQEHSRFIRKNLENITQTKVFGINKKYQFLDKIFLRVIKKSSEIMPDIFFKMFSGSSNTVIKFLSNKSNILEDFSIILKMPKWTFIKALFRN